ncbi:hypothetical protein ACS4RT_12815 [Bacillus amyloliquefaciens]
MELTKKITTTRGTYEIKLVAEEGKGLGWDILEWEVKDLVTKCTLAAGNGMPLSHVPYPLKRLTFRLIKLSELLVMSNQMKQQKREKQMTLRNSMNGAEF